MSTMQTMTTVSLPEADAEAAARAAGRPLPRLTVQDEGLQRSKRRLALTMILVPPFGVAAAIWLAVTTGLTVAEVGIFVLMHGLTTIGVTVGFHRHFAHLSFTARPAVRLGLGILGSMAIQGPVIFWTATHRRHHNFSDREGDPHSPNLFGTGWRAWLRGQWHAHIRWLYAGEISNSARFANDLRRDKVAVWLNQTYTLWALVGLVIPTLLGALWIGGWMGAFKGFLWGGMVRLFVVHHAFWSIGSIAHTFGTRPYATSDHSGNSFWLAIPNFGEGWHNNHHAFPTSAYFGLRWWQVDVGGYVIRALHRLGGITHVMHPTPEQIELKQVKLAKQASLESEGATGHGG